MWKVAKNKLVLLLWIVDKKIIRVINLQTNKTIEFSISIKFLNVYWIYINEIILLLFFKKRVDIRWGYFSACTGQLSEIISKLGKVLVHKTVVKYQKNSLNISNLKRKKLLVYKFFCHHKCQKSEKYVISRPACDVVATSHLGLI